MGAAPNPRALTGRSGASSHGLRFPLRAFLRFPGCPPGSSPSSAVLWFPFVRRSPVRSLRPLPGSGSPRFPSGSPFPWAIFTLALPRGGSAGAGPGRQGPRSPALPRPPRLDRAIRPHCQMDSGWARWDAATESPVTSGAERRTSPRQNRSGGYFARAPKTQVALRDRLPVSLRPRMAAFTAAGYMGMAEVSRRAHGARPCPRHDGALGLDWLAPRS